MNDGNDLYGLTKPYSQKYSIPRNVNFIAAISKEPSPKSGFTTLGSATKCFISAFLYTGLVFIVAFSVNPARAEANIFSVFGSMFANKAEANSPSPKENSQSMELLQPAMNPNPAPRGGGDITIADGTTLVPDVGPSGNAGVPEDEVPANGQISLYVVRTGDTLGQIAKMFDVSINTIVWGNDIKGGIITPGQTLVILPVSGVRHTVKSGDTIASIAKKYKADLGEVLEYNDFASDAKLAVGEVILVPDGQVTSDQTGHSRGAPVRISGAGLPSLPGYFSRPVDGCRKTQGIHGYNGIDIGCPIGTHVKAAAAGTVILSRSSGWNGGYGQYIVVKHDNGTQTLYAHLSANIVNVGETVTAGQVIGAMGSTGRSTGSHLHFEVRGAKNPF